MKIVRTIFAVMLIVGLVLVALPSQVQATTDWDKSSLTFTAGCSGDCTNVQATVCNTGDGAMQGSVIWELWYAVSGNPKFGSSVASGTISPLNTGECTTLSYDPSNSGEYMFRAFQRTGHPGGGDLWSGSCTVNCVVPVADMNLTFLQPCKPAVGTPALAEWRITNPNSFPVNYTIEKAGTGQILSGTAPAGTSFFTTPWGTQTLILKWVNELGVAKQKTKAGGDSYNGTDCDAPVCSATTEVVGDWSDWAVDPNNSAQEIRTRTVTNISTVDGETVCGSLIETEIREIGCVTNCSPDPTPTPVPQKTGAADPSLPWIKVAGLFMASIGLIGFGWSFKKQ